MKNLDKIVDAIEKKLNEKDDLRETALKRVRDIIRMSRKCIKMIHAGKEAGDLLNEAINANKELKKELKEHPDLLTSGYMQNASQEIAEAKILHSIKNGKDLPHPKDIGVSDISYLLGLGDVIGELRRMGMNLLKKEGIAEVEDILEKMELLCDKLMEFDYPSGLLPIKRKQDVAKKLLEKMRSDMVVCTKNKELEEKMEIIIKSLKKKKVKKDNEFGLDVDSVWG
jgi:translin